MKQFNNALNIDGERFQNIVSTFSGSLYENIKANVFQWPQIRTLVRDDEFVGKIINKERTI